MPLTEFQAEIFRIISANRNPESYVAGGIVIHRDAASLRYSRDIDLFHDTSQALATSAKLDSEGLKKAGYEVDFTMQEPMFYRAEIIKNVTNVRLEWSSLYAFPFFHIVPVD